MAYGAPGQSLTSFDSELHSVQVMARASGRAGGLPSDSRIRNLFTQLLDQSRESSFFNDTRVVCKDETIFINKVLVSLASASAESALFSVEHVVDLVLMFPDYTAGELIAVIRALLTEIETEPHEEDSGNEEDTVMVAPSNKKNESIASMLARVSDYFKKTTSVVTTCSDERRAKCVFDRSMNLPEGWMVQTYEGKGKKPSTRRKDIFFLSPQGHLLKTRKAVEEYIKAIQSCTLVQSTRWMKWNTLR